MVFLIQNLIDILEELKLFDNDHDKLSRGFQEDVIDR